VKTINLQAFKRRIFTLNQLGFSHLLLPAIVVVVIVVLGGVVYDEVGRAATPSNADYLESGISGKCLDDSYDAKANNTKVQLYTCNKSAAQQWTINSTGTIENANGVCLDLSQAKYANNTKLVMYTCNTNSAQQWKEVDNTLVNPKSDKCIDDPYSTSTNGTQLILYTCKGTLNQRWTPTPPSSGSSNGSGTTGTGGGTTSSTCTKPTDVIPMTASNVQAGITIGSYYVTNDTWNAAGHQMSQTMNICSASSWYVTANLPKGNTAVLSYPNVHEDFSSAPEISSFKTISSSFAEAGAHIGDYEYAYDMWLNGIADSTSTEVMIWTDNYGQTPSGTKEGSFSDGGQTYTVWKSGSYIAFVDNTNVTSGTLNLLEFYNDIIKQGWIASTSTVLQIDYGLELCSTDGTTATFAVNNFSISTN
jgi:hypothetical protein